VIDDVDQKILEALAENARISLKELAQAAGLSSPSAAERLRRLDERGIIAAFTIDIDPAALGYPLQAIVRVRPLPGQLHVVQRIIQETPQFVECDKVTGDDCFIARLVVRSMPELDTILDKVAEKAETSTSMVKASPVKRRLPRFRASGSSEVGHRREHGWSIEGDGAGRSDHQTRVALKRLRLSTPVKLVRAKQHIDDLSLDVECTNDRRERRDTAADDVEQHDMSRRVHLPCNCGPFPFQPADPDARIELGVDQKHRGALANGEHVRDRLTRLQGGA
jgi:Lrp/AsnC family leucine-responsive transcriptional regulator